MQNAAWQALLRRSASGRLPVRSRAPTASGRVRGPPPHRRAGRGRRVKAWPAYKLRPAAAGPVPARAAVTCAARAGRCGEGRPRPTGREDGGILRVMRLTRQGVRVPAVCLAGSAGQVPARTLISNGGEDQKGSRLNAGGYALERCPARGGSASRSSRATTGRVRIGVSTRWLTLRMRAGGGL